MFGLFKEWTACHISPDTYEGVTKLTELYERLTFGREEFSAFEDKDDLLKWVKQYGREQAHHIKITRFTKVNDQCEVTIEGIRVGMIPKKYRDAFLSISNPKLQATITGGRVASNSGIWKDNSVHITNVPLGIELKFR